ncbi:MAG: hypothetical protein ABSE49_02270 [Polyangiaceae bacterium]
MMLAAALVLGQLSGVLEVSNTSRIDARLNQPLPLAPTPPPREIAIASDATFSPLARLKLGDRRWDYTLTYTPSFTVTDIELITTAQPVVLNAGTASIGWHDRRTRILVTEAASYGWENLAYLYQTPAAGLTAAQTQTGGQTGTGTGTGMGTATGTTVPGQTAGQAVAQTGAAATVPLQTFPFGSSTTTASLGYQATRSLTITAMGGYSLSGNLANNTQATAVYPEQLTPLGSASVMYASSRTLEETWRHRTSATGNVAASLGVSGSIYQLSNGEEWGLLPVGGVSYSERFSLAPKDPRDPLEPSGIRLSADLSPTVNVFTGSPSNRVQVTATLVDRFAQNASISLLAGALQTVPLPHPDPSPLTLFNAAIDLRLRLNRLMSLSLGVQALWQEQQNVGLLPVAATTAGTTTTAAEVGYVALTVRMPRVRL